MVGGGEFLIARGNGAPLLEAIEQALDLVALAVGRPVKARVGSLVLLGRDDCPNISIGNNLFFNRVSRLVFQ